MRTARYVHWQNGGMWLGYFEDFPDYLTQGESSAELVDNLRDLYTDLTSGQIPGIPNSGAAQQPDNLTAPCTKPPQPAIS